MNLGTVIDIKAVQDDKITEYLKDDEIFWRLGTGCIGGRTFNIERKKGLDGPEYRLNGQILDPKSIESWNSTEYFDWRDG